MPPWSCPRCGTVNAGQSAVCVACGTPNPAATAAGAPFAGGQQPPYAPPQQYGAPQQPYGQPYPQQQPYPPQQEYPPQQQYPPSPYGAPGPYPPDQGYPPPSEPGWGAPAPSGAPGGGQRGVIIGLIAVAVIAAAVIVIVLVTRGGSKPTSSGTTSSSTSTASTSTTTSRSPAPSPTSSGTGNLILPDTIAGESKVNDPSLQAALQSQADSLRSQGATGAVAGAYGTNPNVPDKAVFAASGTHPTTAEFTKFLATQFAGGAGVTLVESSKQLINESGTQMTCWVLDKNGSSVGAYCGWNDAETIGFAVQFDSADLTACADFTGAARRAILNQG